MRSGFALPMRLRLALREIRHNGRFSAAFLLSLSLGLFGFVLLGAFNDSVQSAFQARSRAILSADLAVSARRELSEGELRVIAEVLERVAPGAVTTRTLEFYSMAVTAATSASRLSEIIAIEERFPLVGQLELEAGGILETGNPKEIVGAAKAWISQELAIQAGLKRGDALRVGGREFTVADVVAQDTGTSWRGFSLAPRLYLGLDQVREAGLIQKGSTVSYRRYYRLSANVDSESLASELNRRLADPAIQVVTHRRAGEQMARVMAYLGDFLGLVSLVGLLLASLGSAYLFHSFLARRLREMATLMSLGLSHADAIFVYLLQVGLLGLGAMLLASGASILALPAAQAVLERYLAFPLSIAPNPDAFAVALLVGVGGSVLVCLPLILRVYSLKPAILFQESLSAEFERGGPPAVASFPAFAFFYGLSVWQAHSWKIGSLFFGGALLSALLLAGLAVALLRGVGAASIRVRKLSLRLPLRYVARNRLGAVSAFLAVGLGALLINLLPQLQRNIESEIAHPEVSSVPSLFLFDIQEEQLDDLQELLKEEGIALPQVSPLVRARLEAVNDQPFEKALDINERATREEEQEARFRNRGFNLTYRDTLTESESLVAGKPITGPFRGEGLPEISVEQRFAGRLGLRIGDVLKFDIQGVPVSGRIVNLRKVRWTSFQPNFFVQFQSGALADAPKTFLAAVGRTGASDRIRIQNRIVASFPNVSVIDVTAVVRRLLDLSEQMAWALRLMAYLAVFTGLVVLYSIANHQARNRRSEAQLLKILGASPAWITRRVEGEFIAIGLVAALFGVVISTGLSYGISALLFDWAWSFSWRTPLVTVVLVVALTWVTTRFAFRRTLREKPGSLLAEQPT